MASSSASGSVNLPGEVIFSGMKVRPFEHLVQAVGVALMDARQVLRQRRVNRSSAWLVDEPELSVWWSRCRRTSNTCPLLTLTFVWLCANTSFCLLAPAWVWLILAERLTWCYKSLSQLTAAGPGRGVLPTCLTHFLFSSPSSHRENHQEQTLRKWICRLYLPHMPNADIKIPPPPRCF